MLTSSNFGFRRAATGGGGVPVVARDPETCLDAVRLFSARAQETESTTDTVAADGAVPSNVMVSVSIDKKDYPAIVRADYTMIRDFNITIGAGLTTDTFNLSQMTTPGIASCRRATP